MSLENKNIKDKTINTTKNKNNSSNIIIQDMFDLEKVRKENNVKKTIDCITIGRANVDLYPPVGEHLDYARNYESFVGGSPANIATGISCLGLKSAIITRVANDLHGKFVVNYLSKKCNVDCSMVQYDNSEAKTSLAFAERLPEASTIMYRNNSADLYLDYAEINPEDIAKSRSICITGTALTTKTSRKAVLWILNIAKEFEIPCIIDIDYRPYGWNSYAEAAGVFSTVTEMCDIIIGTEEEFAIANALVDSVDKKTFTDKQLVQGLFKGTCKIAVIKYGAEGSVCYVKDNPPIDGFVFNVDLVKPWGAGDAFASSFISYLILGEDIEKALEAGAASAAINIMGQSCTEAMPTREELREFIKTHKKE